MKINQRTPIDMKEWTGSTDLNLKSETEYQVIPQTVRYNCPCDHWPTLQ